MRRMIDDDQVPVPPMDDADELDPVNWAVLIGDDYEDAEPRVILTVEAVGRPAEGYYAHLPAAQARRLRNALTKALGEIGAD